MQRWAPAIWLGVAMATMACDNEEVSREFTLDSVMADASDASDIPDTPTNGSDASTTDTSTANDTEDADDSSMDTMEPPEDTSPDVPPTPTDHRPVLLINAGSDAPLTDRWGRTWEADRGWVGDVDETAAHTEASVVGTPNPKLFQSERRCMSGYQLPLEEGQYTVRLHMAEQADDVTTVGQRLSNLDIEGHMVEHFDPLYEARGPGRATVLTVEALDVVDGTLDIAFGSVVQCANINAIEVLERLEEICNTRAPARRWWPDADGDGRGDRHARPTVAPCAPPAPYAHVEDDADCDDADPTDEASEACAFEPTDCDVWITPSFDAAATVVAGAPGTHYCFRAGIHRLSDAIDPKEGDRFTGEYGAIISGARDLSADSVDWMAQEDGTWCVGGQEQNLAETLDLSTNFGGDVDPEMLPGTYFPEELFSNDRRLTRLSPHTESRADLGPGSWLLDTDHQEICVGDDPATLGRLETSVIPHALTGGRVSDVVVDNLIFEKFAGGWRRAIIGGWFQSPGFDWTVRYSEIRWSHASGINNMPGLTIEHCRIHGHGHMGIHGSNADRVPEDQGGTQYTAPMVLRDSELFDNNALDFSWGNEGAFKLSHCNSCRVERCWVHDVPNGPGIWYDVDNVNNVIQGNLVERVAEHGIFYEISFDSEISYNVVRDGGFPRDRGDAGMAIYISSSSGNEVHHNVTYGTNHELFIRAANRGRASDGTVRDASNNTIHHNHLQIIDGAVGMRIREDAPNSGDYISPPYANIRFENNTYYIADMSANEFYWGRSGGFGPGPMDAVAWDMFWDGAENFVVGDPVHRPAPKGEGPWFTFAHYGPRR